MTVSAIVMAVFLIKPTSMRLIKLMELKKLMKLR